MEVTDETGPFTDRAGHTFFVLHSLCPSAGYIDFTQPQDTHPAAEEPDTKPLRIAFASVMSPKETRQVYQQIVNYISQQENRPAILIQRRTYEELNTLLANGDADVAFSSTGPMRLIKS